MINERLDELIILENQGKLNAEERQELDSMIASSDDIMTYYLDTKSIVSDMSFEEEIKVPTMSFEFDRLEQKPSNVFPLIYRIAAALIIAIGVSYMSYIGYDNTPHYETVDAIKSVTLADGSVVTLNKGSELIEGENFNGSERRVTLIGEAFFDITKSTKPFIITANESQIEVLGTKFNVFTSEEKTTVAVQSGKVRFSKGEKSVLLTKGLAAETNATDVTIIDNERKDYEIASWKAEKWIFKDVTLGEVFEFLEETYDVELIIENHDINDERIGASMSKESIDDILHTISDLFKLEVRLTEGTYHIKRKS